MQRGLFPNNIFQAVLTLIIFMISSSLIIIIDKAFNFEIPKNIILPLSFLLGITLTILLIRKILGKRILIDFNGFNGFYILIYTILIVLLAMFLIVPLTNLINILYVKIPLTNPFESLGINGMILGAFIIGPIVEEVLFRGVILNGLYSKNKKLLKSLIISSFIFSIIHFNAIQMLSSFILGLILGHCFLKTNFSVINPIIVHSFANMFITSITYIRFIFFKENYWYNIYGSYTAYIIGFSMLILIFMIYFLSKKGFFKV